MFRNLVKEDLKVRNMGMRHIYTCTTWSSCICKPCEHGRSSIQMYLEHHIESTHIIYLHTYIMLQGKGLASPSYGRKRVYCGKLVLTLNVGSLASIRH